MTHETQKTKWCTVWGGSELEEYTDRPFPKGRRYCYRKATGDWPRPQYCRTHTNAWAEMIVEQNEDVIMAMSYKGMLP